MSGDTLEDIEASGHFDTALDTGEWFGNEWTDNGEDEMTESVSLESKIVRIQAALDEMTDLLASELRGVVRLVGAGDTLGAIHKLEDLISDVETFSAEPEEEEEEGDETRS